ncbi:hypothetical protein [Streptomyces sp. NPDC048057]|uniref:hypothetical protein n=1 Tax=Streptomyces sp. NPDC048057 TaxID=3155628 RepID=UPI0033EE7270
MSSDQQYPYDPYASPSPSPYGRDQEQERGASQPQPQPQPYAQPQPQQYGQPQPHPQAGAYNPYAGAEYGQQQGHGGHPGHASHPGQPGNPGPGHPQAYPPQQPYQQPQQPYRQQQPYQQHPPQQAQQPYPSHQQQPQGYGYPQQAAHQDVGQAAQTWQGETWDTQYQPGFTQHGAARQPAGPAEETAYLPPVPSAAEQTAYLPPVPSAPSGPTPSAAPASAAEETAYLPPVPAAPASAAEQTAYLPPVPPGPSAGARRHGRTPQGAYPLPPEAPHAAAPPPVVALTPEVVPASADTGYSPPTTSGNTRITDAQRARAEGRSPIIAPGIQPAGLTAALGLLLAGGAAIGSYALLVPLVLLQAVTAAGWFRLNGMWPARQGIALAFLGGFVADVVLLAVGREHGPAAITGTLGVWVLLTVVLQLRSHAGADERMYGLMATVASAALAVVAAGYLAASSDAVVVGGVAVAVAVLARALPVPGVASLALGLLGAAGTGAVVGGLTDLGAQGALLGLAAGVLALVGLRAASYDYPSRFVHFTAGVALPLALAAPAVYLVGRVLA